MKLFKTMTFLVVALMISSLAIAETDYSSNKEIRRIKQGKSSLGTPTMTSATITGALTAGSVVADTTGDVTGNVTGDVTGDVSGNVDAATAVALTVGAATATSVEIADTAVLTDIQGTLSVDEAATFDAQVTVPAGAAATPGIVVGANNHGLYDVSGLQLGLVIAGVGVGTVEDTGLVMTADVSGSTLTIASGGKFQVVGTALQFVSTGGVTNVIDADVTTP